MKNLPQVDVRVPGASPSTEGSAPLLHLLSPDTLPGRLPRVLLDLLLGIRLVPSQFHWKAARVYSVGARWWSSLLSLKALLRFGAE